MAQTITMEDVKRELGRAKVSKLFHMAERYGVIKRGFTGIDYLREAISSHGWESTAITGIKGSAKSNLLLQRGFAIYQDWDTVEKYLVTEKDQFIRLLDTDKRIPWMGVDDIATIFPANLYHADRKLYNEAAVNWETLRTRMNCFDFTCTRKNKVATFILEDITGDIICYNRQGDLKSHYDYQRWLWLRNLKDPTDMIAKPIRIEDIVFPLIPEAFKIDTSLREGIFLAGGVEYHGEDFFRNRAGLTGVPRERFLKYWDARLALTDSAYQKFKAILSPPSVAPIEVQNASRKLLDARKAKRGY